MESPQDFGDVDLTGVRVSNLLNEKNEGEEEDEEQEKIKYELGVISPKEKVHNYSINEEDEDIKENIIKTQTKVKIIRKINCDNYMLVFVDFIIQSLISFGFYYLCYVLQFDFQETILKIGLLIFLFILIIIIYIFGKKDFYSSEEKSSNIILFITINILKITFDVLLYLLIVSDKDNDGIDYSHFEARAYWKICMTLFHLFFLIYYYVQKDNDDFNINIYLLCALVCIIICATLIILTQTENNNVFRIINNTGFLLIEIFLVTYATYFENRKTKIFEYLQIKLYWQVNRIDFLRFGIVIFAGIFKLVLFFVRKCRCCRRYY